MSIRVGIAGSGLVGRLVAYHLIEKGYRVSLFERGDKSGRASCGFIAAGMLSPYAELERAELPVYWMGKHACAYWNDFACFFDSPAVFTQSGSLVVAHEKDVAELERFKNILQLRLNTQLAVLSAAELFALEPHFAQYKQSLFLPQEAYVDSRLVFQLLANYLENKVEGWFCSQNVQEVSPFTITIEEKNLSFDWVFDCRGLGAAAQLPELRGVRGELLWLYAPAVQLARPIRIMHPRYRLYLLPRPGHYFILGASEIESADDSPLSVRSALELLTAVYSLHPGFSEARIVETCVGCRPAFFDNLPKILGKPGYTAINGLYRHGYLLAPIVVQDAIAWAFGNRAEIRYPEYIHSV